jgi:hypothetical protein
MVDVIPVSDPNASTMSQKVVQYQAVFQLSQSAPQIYDLPYLHRQMIETLGVKNADKIVPTEDDMKPVDPVTENMHMMNGKPVKAFLYQDHDAHINVHMNALNDPKIAALLGQNPQAQVVQGAFMAHIMEHAAFSYRKQIEQQLGAMLPPMPEDGEGHLDPEVEVQVSALAQQASDRLFQKHSAEAQQQQAQQAAQDPMLQLQQMDIQVKQQEVQRKAQKDQMEQMAKTDELRLKQAELEAKYQMEHLRLLTESTAQADELDARGSNEEARLSMDVLKMHQQANKPQPSPAAPPKGNK